MRKMDGIGKLSVLLLISSCLAGISATKCRYCQKDFNVLGRHEWRCKSRVPSSTSCEGRQPAQPIHENDRPAGDSPSPHTSSTDQASTTTTYFTCTCGRRCKGRRGLKSHQRCCTTHQTLASITQDTNDPMNESSTTTIPNVNNDDNSVGNNHTQGSTNESASDSSCRPGLKLPKTPTQWKEANAFFHHAFLDILDMNTKIDDLNIWVLSIQDRVYDYFSSTYGTVNLTTQSDLYDKYNNTSIKNMKRILKKLKHDNANIDEIKFLSKLIRKKWINCLRILNRKPWNLISTTHSGKPVGGYSTRRRIHCQHSLSNVALNIFGRRLPAILRNRVSKFLRGFRSYLTQPHRTTTPFLHTKKWRRRSGGRGHRHPDRFSISSRLSYWSDVRSSAPCYIESS